MILLWSKHQTGPAAQAIRYLLETEVTKTAQQQASVTRRSPAPELLLGDPILVGMMIDSLPFQCRYRCATLSWAEDELDVARFNEGAPDALAFPSGLDPRCWWGPIPIWAALKSTS